MRFADYIRLCTSISNRFAQEIKVAGTFLPRFTRTEKSFESHTQAKLFACYPPQFFTAFQNCGGCEIGHELLSDFAEYGSFAKYSRPRLSDPLCGCPLPPFESHILAQLLPPKRCAFSRTIAEDVRFELTDDFTRRRFSKPLI